VLPLPLLRCARHEAKTDIGYPLFSELFLVVLVLDLGLKQLRSKSPVLIRAHELVMSTPAFPTGNGAAQYSCHREHEDEDAETEESEL
jgi:hypothetical protein